MPADWSRYDQATIFSNIKQTDRQTDRQTRATSRDASASKKCMDTQTNSLWHTLQCEYECKSGYPYQPRNHQFLCALPGAAGAVRKRKLCKQEWSAVRGVKAAESGWITAGGAGSVTLLLTPHWATRQSQGHCNTRPATSTSLFSPAVRSLSAGRAKSRHALWIR